MTNIWILVAEVAVIDINVELNEDCPLSLLVFFGWLCAEAKCRQSKFGRVYMAR
jgi:hypothetical protein